MTALLDTTLRISIVVLGALIIAVAFRRWSAALRHWILAAGMSCAVVVPLLQIVLPSWHIDGRALWTPAARTGQAGQVETSVIVSSVAATDDLRSLRSAPPRDVVSPSRLHIVLLTVWLAGALLSIATLVGALWRLRRIRSSGEHLERGRLAAMAGAIRGQMGIRRPVTLILGSDECLLVTWGALKPVIVLPRVAQRWTEERARIVLQHEFAHVARGDWPVQMMAESLRAVYWFNPLLWIACGRLRHESERACDDEVLRSGVSALDYASHLLDLARGALRTRTALAIARSSSLEGRVNAMLNPRLTRYPVRQTAKIATLAAFVALTVPIATGQTRLPTLSGSVVDQTNRFVPGATLVLTNDESHATHEARTDQAGRFDLAGLTPGRYELEVRHVGFKTFTEPVAVNESDLTRTIHLQIGTIQETVTVRWAAERAGNVAYRRTDVESSREKAQQARQQISQKCADGAPSGDLGGQIVPPLKVIDIRPEYPDALKGSGIEGAVTLQAVIGTDGAVRSLSALSSPHPDLERAAMEAVQRWEFSTTYLNCTPVEVPMRVTIKFVGR